MKAVAWVVGVLAGLTLIIGGGIYFWNNRPEPEPVEQQVTPKSAKTKSLPASSQQSAWKKGGMAIAGKFADAEAVDLQKGQYRMYYAVEPEVQGNNLEIYSATSTDGITWTQEEGTRKTLATFPDVLLTDNGYRMYFQNTGVIKSATSTDGLTFKDEPGIRVDLTGESSELGLARVAAPTTHRLADGTYVMVYRGDIEKGYSDQVPNKSSMGVLLWAMSKDGLTWEKKGLAVDTRTTAFEGWADGPEFVQWDAQTMKLFFWGYKGVYESVFANNTFSTPALVYQGDAVDEKMMYPPNPPGDPTIMKIGATWYMYYGIHTVGIGYATLRE